MNWLDSLALKRHGDVGHTFLLHLGTNDLQLRDGKFTELRTCLAKNPPLMHAQFLAYFNRAQGIQFVTAEMEHNFLRFLSALSTEEDNLVARFLRNRSDISFMLGYFSWLLGISWAGPNGKLSNGKDIDDAIRGVFTRAVVEEKTTKGASFFSAIIEYTESLAPQAGMSSATCIDRDCTVALLEWAKNETILNARNTVVIVTRLLADIAEPLLSETNGITTIKIPLLMRVDREETLKTLQRESAIELAIPADRLAYISAGLSRRNLMQLAREARAGGITLTEDYVFKLKEKQLEDQGRGMIVMTRSPWGFEAIGALSEPCALFREIADAMKSGDILAVPQGILVLGPPGTGKTVLVEALSHATDIQIFEQKNVRDPFVGVAERNQDFVTELQKSYAPGICVFDEIDQELIERGNMYHGDSGVTSRIQRIIMKITSDTNYRGQLLFVGISNRPDLLDQAFLREGRFDIVIPVLPPTLPAERSQIGHAILYKLACQAKEAGTDFTHNLSNEFLDSEFGWITHRHYDQPNRKWVACPPTHTPNNADEPSDVKGLTGAEIEFILTSAYQQSRRQRRILGDDDLRHAVDIFYPKRKMDEFEAAIDAALRFCNNIELVPPAYRKRFFEIKTNEQGPQGGMGRVINTGQYL